MNKFLFFSCLILLCKLGYGQTNNFWTTIDKNVISNVNDNNEDDNNEDDNSLYYTLNTSQFKALLNNAPLRSNSSTSDLSITIPYDDGSFGVFKIYEVQTLSPSLATRFPDIKSYVGINKNKPTDRVAITLTPSGVQAKIFSPEGPTIIKPIGDNGSLYKVFNANDVILPPFHCEFENNLQQQALSTASNPTTSFLVDDSTLRTYRFAVATTGEYSDYHINQAGLSGGTVPQKKTAVLAAMTVSLDRVNSILENDLAIRLQFIPNTDDYIFLDATTDPYSSNIPINNFSSTLLTENRNYLHPAVGSDNYDIGHVFAFYAGFGAGGVANIRALCWNNSLKAGGVTSSGTPEGEGFDLVLAHEIGHQLGANHTFNNSCDGNRSDNTAYETGSGVTIMAYAGICAPNVVTSNNKYDHYHANSIIEMFNHISSSSCGQSTTIANSPPTTTPLTNYTIPKSTPFVLDVQATDIDSDIITYNWEQFDNEISTQPPLTEAIDGPSFRGYDVSTSSTRYFPRLDDVLAGEYGTIWEVLPGVARDLNFIVTVRDNNALGGQVVTESNTLTVEDTAGPFRVTSQAGSKIIWGVNDTETIAWDVANTNNIFGVNSQIVDILMTTDNGNTFFALATNTPNDGSQDITVPNTVSSNVRIMVKSADNVFFDLNEATIEIQTSPPSCIPPQNLELVSVFNTTATISWIGSQSNPSSDYDYVLITDGSVPGLGTIPTGTIPFNSTSVNLTGLTANNNYDFYIRANCGGGDLSEWSSVLNFATTCNPISAPYLENFDDSSWITGDPGEINNCWRRRTVTPGSDFIWRVNSGPTGSADTGPNNDVSGNGKYLYTEASAFDVLTMNQFDVTVMEAPPIDLSPLTAPRMKISYHMYGDGMGKLNIQAKGINSGTYNNLFTIEGEQQTANSDPFLEETIDLSTYSGQIVSIRIIGERGGNFNSDLAIDNLIVEETTGCASPQNLAGTNLTSSGFDLTWDNTPNGVNGHEWVIMPDEVSPDPINAVATGTELPGVNNAQISGLNSITTYNAYVRANCGLNGISSWSDPLSIKTPCDPLIAPFTETFDGTEWVEGAAGSIDVCWTRSPEVVSPNYGWRVNSGGTPSSGTGPLDDVSVGGKYLYTEASLNSLDDEAILNTPPIDLSALSAPAMTISFHMFGSDMGSLSVEVKKISDLTYSTVFTVIGQQQNANSDPFIEQFIDLSAYAGDTVNIKIVALRGGGFRSDIAIDQFVIEENACLAPANINLSSITSLDASLSWDSQPSVSDGFEWVLMPEGLPPDFSNAISTGSESAMSTQSQITGLSAQTTYDVYVRSQCGGGIYSAWSSGINFTTPCTTIIAPYTENFDGSNWTSGNPGVIDNCWFRSTLTPGSDFIWIVNNGTTLSDDTGPQSDVSGSGNYLYTEASAFDPPFMNEFDQTVLESPPIDLTGINVPRLKFRYHMYGASMGSLKIEVKGISNPTYAELFSISGQQQTASSDAFIEQRIDLSSFTGQVINVRILGERGSNFTSDIAIDNFTIDETTNCNMPSGLQANNVTISSADLNWDPQTNALFDLRYRETGATTWIEITDLSTNNTTLNGLTELTEYEVQVRSKCTGESPSDYSPSIFFTTALDPSFCTVFEDFDTGLPFGWSTVVNTGNCDWTNQSATPGTFDDFPTPAMVFDDDACGNGAPASNVSLLSDVYDTSDASSILIAYDVAFQEVNSEETLTVEVWDGAAWQQIAFYNADLSPNIQTETDIDATAFANPDFQIRWTYDDGGAWGWHAGVDNFCLRLVFPPPCTVFEDFEAGLPAGWSTVVNTGTCDWTNQSAISGPFDDFPTLAMVFDDDVCGSGAPASNVSLLSDVYDASGASPILISYDVAFQEVNLGETLTVEVWDGAAWQQIAFYNADLSPNIQTETDIDATAFANPDFQVRWTYDDSGAWGWHAGVDNFCLKLSFNNWEGTISTDWNTPGNWSLGAIPTNTDTAVIQDVLNQPLIDASTTAEIDNLILNSNTVVSIEGILKVSNNISNDGEIVFKNPPLSQAGQFDTFTGTISRFGTVTVERYIPAKRAFRLLSSPVTTSDFIYENWQESGSTPVTPDGLGTHITGGDASLGFDQNGSGNPSMFTFDNSNSNGTPEQNDDWQSLSNTNATKLRAGEAYLTMVRGDRTIDLSNGLSTPTITTLRAKGDLFTGTLSYSVGNATSYLNVNDVDDFYNLIANPYQAVVDYNAVTRTGLTDFIYVWDASIAGANGRGGYVTVELPAGSATEGEPPSPSSSDADQYLAPGMSFFVQNDDTGATSTSITFDEADKATAENQVTVFSTYTNFYINSRLYKSSNLQNGDTESDAIGLRFSDDFTTPGDSEDATKLFNPGENYAIVNNGLRSIDKQQIPTIGHQIDLSILNYQETNYSLTFMMENKPAGLDVFIIDNYLNTQTELAASFVYDFSVDANIPQSVAEDRFSLVFDTTTLNVDENTFGEGFRLYPNPVNNGQFSIRTPNLSGEVTVELVNMLGQKVMSKNLTIEGNEVNVNAGQLSDGVYIVKLVKDKKTFVTKLIVE